MSQAYAVVAAFEGAVARHVGAEHAVALDNCTNALEMCLRYLKVGDRPDVKVRLPRHTFLSVPMAVMHAGARPEFVNHEWVGQYRLDPYMVWDSAAQLEPGSYQGGLMCLSFQFKKPVPIGKGGMVCTGSSQVADWLRRARYLGRRQSPFPYPLERVTELGWNRTMTPEQAARGLTLLELAPPTKVGSWKDYPDVSVCPVWTK